MWWDADSSWASARPGGTPDADPPGPRGQLVRTGESSQEGPETDGLTIWGGIEQVFGAVQLVFNGVNGHGSILTS